MGCKQLLLAGTRVNFFRPTTSKNLILQHRRQFTRHFSVESTNNSREEVFKRLFSRTLSFGKEKVCGIPYFPIVLGFAISGCLGTGLLVVFADEKSHGPLNISNSKGLLQALSFYLLRFHLYEIQMFECFLSYLNDNVFSKLNILCIVT